MQAEQPSERERLRNLFEQYKMQDDVVLWIKSASRHAFRVWSDGFKAGQRAALSQPTPQWLTIESAPKEPGRYIYVQQTAVYRWLPYKANSQEFRRGKKGRWQKHTGYGFDNAELSGEGWRDTEDATPLPVKRSE